MKIIVKTKLSGIQFEDNSCRLSLEERKELTDHLVRRVKELDKQQQKSQLPRIVG
jgi:hypothetical protein